MILTIECPIGCVDVNGYPVECYFDLRLQVYICPVCSEAVEK